MSQAISSKLKQCAQNICVRLFVCDYLCAIIAEGTHSKTVIRP